MNNREEIIKLHKELIMSMSVEQLKEVFNDNDLQEDYEKILFAMPVKAEMETLRVSLATNLTNWVEYDHLSTEDITSACEYLLSILESETK